MKNESFGEFGEESSQMLKNKKLQDLMDFGKLIQVIFN